MTQPPQRPSLAESSFPLAFRVDPDSFPAEPVDAAASHTAIRIVARALDGMQKEAIAQSGPDAWRLVSDEGPWLNGTDLAPFPLAFFCAGQAASYLAEFMAEAKGRLIPVTRLELRQDNFFTMEGSALRGTMVAGVDPVQLQFDVDGEAAPADWRDIADIAVNDRSPVAAVLGGALPSEFAIRADGEHLTGAGVAAVGDAADPIAAMSGCRPVADGSYVDNIIQKDAAAGEPIEPGGAIGLKASQKRTLHVSTHARVRADGLKELAVQCIQPAGSRFIMLSDDAPSRGGRGRAPDPMTYLSCGVAFCFMTQIGRYAEIVKQQLHDYRIVQDTSFGFGADDPPSASPVATLVCLETAEAADDSRKLVRMAEQTCYIHGAFRMPVEMQLGSTRGGD